MKTPLWFALLVSTLCSVGSVGAAPGLSLTTNGLAIDNGVDAPLVLTLPTLVNEARKDAKISKATQSGANVVVDYEGGGQLVVEVKADAVVFTASVLPAGIKYLHSTLRIGPEYAGVGQWALGAVGAVLQPFPKDKPASPFLYKGAATDFDLAGPTGVKTSLRMPAYSYNQLNDNREWHGNFFQWHVWIPYVEGTACTLNITAVAGTAPAASAAPVAAAPAAPAAVALAPTPFPKEVLPALKNPGDTRVQKWKDGRRGVFMIQFDDSASSHITYVIPELKRRGIPGTFYINPGNGPYKGFQSQWEREASSPGIELANHTFTHIGGLTVDAFEQEIVKCNDVLNQLYPARKQPRLISWGRPGVPKDKWGITEAEIQQVLAKHHMVERPQFAGPPFSVKTIPEMNKWVDEALVTGEMKSLVFHGVGGDWLVTPLDYFTALLDKLAVNREQLWLTTPLAWHQYATERKTASVKVLQSDAALIRLDLASQADPVYYDLPLSLVTKVPAAWKKCAVTQGSAKSEVPVVDGEARYDALPGAGPISLKAL